MSRARQLKQRYVRYLSNGVVDGIILYASYDSDEAVVRELHASEFPFVLIESSVEGVKSNNLLIDNEGGTYNAVRYLHRFGHQRIAYIAGPVDKHICVERLGGYLKAMKKSVSAHRQRASMLYTEWLQRRYGIMERLLSLPQAQRPTAVLCYDDAVASYAIRFAMEKGYRVPEEISVMGFDNQTILPDGYRGPSITSVSQPLYDIGFDSMILLTQILRGEK